MLNFRDELSKIIQDQKEEFENQSIMTECLEALLFDFRKMKKAQSKTFFFRVHENQKLKVMDSDNKVIFEQDFQNEKKAKKFMLQLQKYFSDQNYKVEPFYFSNWDFCLEIVI